MPQPPTRRAFLAASARAGLALSATALARPLEALGATARPASAAAARPLRLIERFPDLHRHFIFDFYPWYGGPPDYLHWDYLDRHPPTDLSSNFVPRLGAYDSRSRAVLEQQARWIAESGVGSVALSWWGPGHYTDAAVHDVMDVMRDHDIKVTFHLEPYRPDRGLFFARDVQYLLREYGDRRRWDCFLLLRDENGRVAPVFKGFACILPPTSTDCHGITRLESDYTADDTWAAQLDTVREDLRRDLDVTLLADSLDVTRTLRSGFDGIAIYSNVIPPESYATHAANMSRGSLLFSFNVNPGFHMIPARDVDPEGCYEPPTFVPPATPPVDWSTPEGRERAARLSMQRIAASLEATLRVQTDPQLENTRRGFFVVYVNSFNEWHEGHSFEPMKDAAQLAPEERALGYHNPADGAYRISLLRALLRPVLEPPRKRARAMG